MTNETAEKAVFSAAAPSSDMVACKVTKKGDGRISQGEHVAGEGDVKFGLGDTVRLVREVAEALAAIGLVVMR